jgi:oxidase EvaA
MQDGVARTVTDLKQALNDCRVGFEVTRVPAAAATQWSVIDGALQHQSRGFFSAGGVRLGGGEERVLLYQPQGAVTGLLTARIGGETCYLLQARAEPGCLGEAQFGPTVQSTPANFMRMHGGATTPYIDTFIAHEAGLRVIDDTTQLDLGERYFCKSKRSILVQTAAPPAPQPAFVWASAEAIRAAVLESAFLNIDLRSILSIAAWEDSGDGLTPRSLEVHDSLRAPLRSEALGAVMAELRNATRDDARFVPLAALENWRATEWGWSEREARQGFAIDFFEVTAPLREKATWVQPLVNSAGDGHAVLVCRKRGGVLEFLVSMARETGLATSAALAPSFVSYPGANAPTPDWLARCRPWSATIESDEGGRFYRDASRYEIVRADDWNDAAPDAGFWLTLAEIKLLLRTSNMCTIQLRGLVSQLLGVV